MSVLKIQTLALTPFQQNVRVLLNEAGGGALVVDPGGDIGRLRGASCFAAASQIEAIFLTHAHLDHAGGVKQLYRELAPAHPPLLAHRLDRPLRESISAAALLFGLDRASYEDCPEPDIYLEDSQELLLAGLKAKVLFTPGHAPGHICLYFSQGTFELLDEERPAGRHQGPLLIGGDLLFAGSIGRTDLPGGDHQALLKSVREKIFTLPEETLILSGHGPSTTVGREKKTNPFFIP